MGGPHQVTRSDPAKTSAGAPAGRARTLSEALQAFSRAEIVRLLELRPDLCYPVPVDLVEVAARATTAASAARALESVNAFLRIVVEAMAALPAPTSIPSIVDLLGSPEDESAVGCAVAQLRARALLWCDGQELQLVRAARELFEPYPGALSPPSHRPMEDPEIAARLAECDETVHAVLARLAWSPTGTVRNAERAIDPAHARTPVEQLLSRRLLRPLDADTVILPREVALYLRDGRFSRQPVCPTQPDLDGEPLDLSRVDSAAAGAAFALVHDLEVAVHALEMVPHRLLRSGGLATRDVATLARRLHGSPAYAGFVLEVAAAAGLVGSDRGTLLPVAGYDRWTAHDPAVRWRVIADAWLGLGRLPSRSGEPGAHVLGPEAETRAAAELRATMLDAALRSGPGFAPDPDRLAGVLRWERPGVERGFGLDLPTFLRWGWQEAEWLGVVALGAPSSFASALLRPGDPLPVDLVHLFPTPVEQVIVQADLTAVAPGPLPPSIGRDLRLLAEQESAGGGGVYRFSPESLRRAVDAGWSPTEVHAWLEQHSATGVPQPLRYLVDDVARRFGTVRVGTALSYLRVEDHAQVAALLAHPDAPGLGLREVGPGVIVSSAEPTEVVDLLRRLGQNPAVEDDRGALLDRAPARRATNPLRGRPARPPGAETVADLLVRPGRGEPDGGRVAISGALDAVRAAVRSGSPLRLRYVTDEGAPTMVSLTRVQLEPGLLRGVEAGSGRLRAVPIARVAAVESVPASPSDQPGSRPETSAADRLEDGMPPVE
jgi:hypothetical protein